MYSVKRICEASLKLSQVWDTRFYPKIILPIKIILFIPNYNLYQLDTMIKTYL